MDMLRKPLIQSHFDTLIWCGACFLLSVACFWWPVLSIIFGPDAQDPNINIGRAVWFGVVLTSPFMLTAAVGAVIAFRKLYLQKRRTDGQVSHGMITMGAIFTFGSVLPPLAILTLLLIFFLQRV